MPPDGVTRILRFETDIVFAIGRTQLLGPDDVPKLVAVQDGYRLRSLSEFAGTTKPPAAPAVDWPMWDDAASRDERFIGYAEPPAHLLRAGIHADDSALVQRLAASVSRQGAPFDADTLDAPMRETPSAPACGRARRRMEAAAETMPAYPTGWSNSDAFGDRAYYAGDYAKRAAGAQLGWGGNDRIEAMYPILRHDADGEVLDGSRHAYTMTWKTDPPTHAFWSVTMYDRSYDGSAGYHGEEPDRSVSHQLDDRGTGARRRRLTRHVHPERETRG